MNSKIEPHYVDFNTAKLLKEKGFDVPCGNLIYEGDRIQSLKGEYYRNTFLSFKGEDVVIPNEEDWKEELKNNPDKFDRKLWGIKIIAPEQWQICEWLRINHGIWINVNWYPENEINKWNSTIDKIGNFKQLAYLKDFNSPQEAYSAAIDYVLNNLI